MKTINIQYLIPNHKIPIWLNFLIQGIEYYFYFARTHKVFIEKEELHFIETDSKMIFQRIDYYIKGTNAYSRYNNKEIILYSIDNKAPLVKITYQEEKQASAEQIKNNCFFDEVFPNDCRENGIKHICSIETYQNIGEREINDFYTFCRCWKKEIIVCTIDNSLLAKIIYK